jgi:hypothetical protein
VGCAIADLVLDIRTSGNLWTRQGRGVDRTMVLPLPLVSGQGNPGEIAPGPDQKRELRRQLGLPEQGIMFLTVGSAAKYQPITGLDFLKTSQAILDRLPEARIVAVGPADYGEWRAMRLRTGNRLIPMGRQPDSTLFCRAADIYLEGFPSGSLTALLEAAEAGLPCVRCPADIVPPNCSDDPAMEDIAQPRDVPGYVETALALARDPGGSAEKGRAIGSPATCIATTQCRRSTR